jgi:glucose uptake protein
MYSAATFAAALAMTMLGAVFWGAWASTHQGTRNYALELFYGDIAGVVLVSIVFAFTLSSHGPGESFRAKVHAAVGGNILYTVIGGFIFNIANLLLVAGIAIASLAIAFPIATGIAVIEGVVLSYALPPKSNRAYLAGGVALAPAATVFDGMACKRLGGNRVTKKGIAVDVIAGLLMGGFAPFVTPSMTAGWALTPYSVAVFFSLAAFLCCFVANPCLMKYPLLGERGTFRGFWRASAKEHLLGLFGGCIWGLGGGFNFVAAGFVGAAISYTIGNPRR